MQKLLFFDYRGLDVVRNFQRQLQHPVKSRHSPLFVADQPWENGNMQLYGSVVKPPDGPFQLWYSTIQKPWWIRLAYAESDDGITWHRPCFDIYKFRGRKTNVVLTDDVHGPAVIRDPADPDPTRRYKLVTGMSPSNCIKLFFSPDGIRWRPLAREPQIPSEPDSPMAFLRTADGRYAVHHRARSWARRICRSDSFDLKTWSEPRMVLEPGPADPAQLQFYGMGAATYGPYEIGTLWPFHTDEDELGRGHMNGYQETELTYSRSGYAWHRIDPGNPFIPHGRADAWDGGNLQCASQPVFLKNEIRYYYMGTDMRHKRHWELDPQTAGLGFARLKPDRFLALKSGKTIGELLTVAFVPEGGRMFINASTGKNGWIKASLLDDSGKPLPGFRETACHPISGNSTALRVCWRKNEEVPTDRPLRFCLRTKEAKVFSIYFVGPNEKPVYYQFKGIG